MAFFLYPFFSAGGGDVRVRYNSRLIHFLLQNENSSFSSAFEKKNGKITLKINSLKRKSSLGKTVLDVIHFVCVAAQRNAISQMYFKTGADRHRETELNRPNIFMMLRKRTVRFIFIEVVDYSLSMQLVHLHSVSFCFFVVQYGVKPFKNTCATILSLFVIFFLHFARPFQSNSFTYSLESRFSLAL